MNERFQCSRRRHSAELPWCQVAKHQSRLRGLKEVCVSVCVFVCVCGERDREKAEVSLLAGWVSGFWACVNSSVCVGETEWEVGLERNPSAEAKEPESHNRAKCCILTFYTHQKQCKTNEMTEATQMVWRIGLSSADWMRGWLPYYTLQPGCLQRQHGPIGTLYPPTRGLAQSAQAYWHVILTNQGVGTSDSGRLAYYTR